MYNCESVIHDIIILCWKKIYDAVLNLRCCDYAQSNAFYQEINKFLDKANDIERWLSNLRSSRYSLPFVFIIFVSNTMLLYFT